MYDSAFESVLLTVFLQVEIKKWAAAYKKRGDGVEARRQYLAENSFSAARVAERAYFEFRDFRDVFVDMDAEAKGISALLQGEHPTDMRFSCNRAGCLDFRATTCQKIPCKVQ